MAKRLTEKQIEDIIKSFSKGETINSLSKKFKCTNPTIIRNLKKNLGELKYSKLINKNKLPGGKVNKIKPNDTDGLNKEIIEATNIKNIPIERVEANKNIPLKKSLSDNFFKLILLVISIYLNASCRIRTCGPLLRRQLLYPAELRKHLLIISDTIGLNNQDKTFFKIFSEYYLFCSH